MAKQNSHENEHYTCHEVCMRFHEVLTNSIQIWYLEDKL